MGHLLHARGSAPVRRLAQTLLALVRTLAPLYLLGVLGVVVLAVGVLIMAGQLLLVATGMVMIGVATYFVTSPHLSDLGRR